MIYAILAIFASMSIAEQELIIDSSCARTPAEPVHQQYDNRLGLTTIYDDGSSITVNNYSTIARSETGTELFYAGGK